MIQIVTQLESLQVGLLSSKTQIKSIVRLQDVHFYNLDVKLLIQALI